MTMNMLYKSTIMLLAGLFFLTGSMFPVCALAAESAAPEDLGRRLQDLYGSLTSLTFDFSQITRAGGRERTGSGDAIFYRVQESIPQKSPAQPERRSVMRWNYTEPDRQVIINDGTTLFIYTENDRQLIRTPAGELESDITYAFFSGSRNLLEDFEVRAGSGSDAFLLAEKLDTIVLIPRQPHNQIKSVQLWFDEQGLIHHLLIEDHFDSATELNFTKIVLNSLPPDDPEIIDSVVSLDVPPDTEIISR